MFIILYEEVQKMLHDVILLRINMKTIKTIIHASNFIGYLQGFSITK